MEKTPYEKAQAALDTACSGQSPQEVVEALTELFGILRDGYSTFNGYSEEEAAQYRRIADALPRTILL